MDRNVIGQDAKPAGLKNPQIKLEDLPPRGTTRWVIRRKAAVVEGVRTGLITLEEACRRYTLSVEEFLSWQRLIDQHGARGLRVTRLKDYRASQQAPAGDQPGAASANTKPPTAR